MLDIKVLGTGCPNCLKLETLCREIIEENGIEATIEKVTSVEEFGNYGVMITPGLVVNGKVLSQGKIPTKATLISWLFSEIA
jgi:small redox-active disulfide protein 2